MTETVRELGALRARADAAARAQRELDEQLVATRKAGATWEQVREALGLNTRQAAQYHHDAAAGRIEQRRAGQ